MVSMKMCFMSYSSCGKPPGRSHRSGKNSFDRLVSQFAFPVRETKFAPVSSTAGRNCSPVRKVYSVAAAHRMGGD